jgi:hypothetical protein
MRRALFMAGNLVAGVVLVLLILDPKRGLMPIFALVAVAVVLAPNDCFYGDKTYVTARVHEKSP